MYIAKLCKTCSHRREQWLTCEKSVPQVRDKCKYWEELKTIEHNGPKKQM